MINDGRQHNIHKLGTTVLANKVVAMVPHLLTPDTLMLINLFSLQSCWC